MKHIELRDVDDETMNVYVVDDNPGGRDIEVFSVNHDQHGWMGFDLVEQLTEKLGKHFGFEVKRS